MGFQERGRKMSEKETAVIRSNVLTVSSIAEGAMLTSIRAGKTEFLWQGDPEYWSGQSPVCFPICGSLRGDAAHCGAGEVKNIKRHGFARFETFEKTAQDEHSVSYVLNSSPATKEIYPYDFRFTLSYRVEDNRLIFSYKVKNTGAVPMPFFIGGHPAFNCPLSEGESYEDYQIHFEEKECANLMYPLDSEPTLLDEERRRVILDDDRVLRLDHSLFQHDGLVFDNLKSRSLTYVNPKTGRGLKLDFDDFSNLVIWSTAKPAPFVALEPWNGFSTKSSEDDVLEHKVNVQTAQPGEEKAYSFIVTVL
jgi:galactose mutarotase-like enzyme